MIVTPNRPRGRPRGTETRLLHEHAGHLGRHHFAFLRALLDGVELEQAWTRYLAFSGGPSDRRHFVSRQRQVVEAIEHAGVRQACAAELAAYKRPVRVEFLDEIPRNPSGKVLRKVLRQRLDEQVGAGQVGAGRG